MESEPDTENVVYLDERRKARWFRRLEEARDLGGVAVFNTEQPEPGKVVSFPNNPDDAA